MDGSSVSNDMKKSCKTCRYIVYAMGLTGELIHSCTLLGDTFGPIEEIEDYCCDDYKRKLSKKIEEKPSKEEILDAITLGVIDALNLSDDSILEAIRQGVCDAFGLYDNVIQEAIQKGVKEAFLIDRVFITEAIAWGTELALKEANLT